jgi:alkylated DNA repair dioxygenase AlkB
VYNRAVRWLLDDDAEVELIADFIDPAACDAVFAAVDSAVVWQSRQIRIAGRLIDEPRQTAWIGDADAVYTYSGRRNAPEPWPQVLSELRARVCETTQTPFNSVLCNLYRDGRDSMGMHADNEPELGDNPRIASLSLGATRRFQLRHRRVRTARLDLDLASGSLLVMSGALQRHYRHGVPKQAEICEPRINLTFRCIQPAAR